MGVREDFVCDDFKTVPVPHLNRQFEYEEINCAGYDIPPVNYKINSYLKIPGLAKCEPTYECSRWQEEYRGDDFIVPGYWKETSCDLSSGEFSHCSQCNMCTSIEDAQIKVRI